MMTGWGGLRVRVRGVVLYLNMGVVGREEEGREGIYVC